jgi:uncharacterized protein YndB with AHSA1/START domain
MRFESSVHIEASPARVYEVFSDVERWPEWTASITSVERLEPGPLTVGAKTRIKQPKLPVAVWEVTEIVEGSHFIWIAKGPGVRTVGGHYVEPDGTGARAISRIDQEGPGGWLIGTIYKGLSNRYLAMEGAGLKARSEQTG